MGLVILAAIGAFVVLRKPLSAGEGGPNKLTALPKLGSVAGLYGSGRSPLPTNDSSAAGFEFSPEQICGALAGATAKELGLSADQVAKIRGLPSYITQPICYANLKVIQYGIQEGKQAYEWGKDQLSKIF